MTIQEILTGEKDKIEYKVDIPPKSETYMRTVVAYANAGGGCIVFGVQDNTWEVIGFSQDEVFRKMDAITNAIYDSCEPKIIPNVSLQEIDGKYIIIAAIQTGTQCPYFIRSQGMVDGVYVRVSGTTRKATLYQIQEMILRSRNRYFDQEKVDRELREEEIASLCGRLYAHAVELCFDAAQSRAIRKIGKNQMIACKLIREEAGRCYATNGYQLLDGKMDDYPDAVIQCAVFKGTTRNVFITRKEYTGPIDTQVESAYAFVLEHIDMGARFEGLSRQDIYELPIRSIREMITNAVCHRSYLSPGKIQVALYDDRLEVTSPGMLDQDLTIEKMKTGQSKIRNRGIAQTFAYMHMIEGWGSGIPDLFRDAQQYGLPEPVLEDRGSDFRINLYRHAMKTDWEGVVNPLSNSTEKGSKGHETLDGVSETLEGKVETLGGKDETLEQGSETLEGEVETLEWESGLTPQEEKLLGSIRLDPGVTQKQLCDRTGISLSAIKRLLPELQERGILVRTGGKRYGKWLIKV